MAATPSLPCRGAALLSALLTVALAAMLAAGLLAQVGHAVDLVAGRHDLAQAQWLARGAIDWARNVLAEDARSSSVDHPGEAWALRVPPTAVEEGELSGEISDLDGRFNVNRLWADGRIDPAALAAYRRLLASLGFAPEVAAVLADGLADWLDADVEALSASGAEASWYAAQEQPWRPANGPLLELAELHRIRGYTPEIVDRLRPFLAVLPQPAPVNVNTAAPEVLAAVLPGLALDEARRLAEEGRRAWCRDLNDFRARLPSELRAAELGDLGVGSRYFLVTGRARYGAAVSRLEVLLSRGAGWPAIVWQKVL